MLDNNNKKKIHNTDTIIDYQHHYHMVCIVNL